MIHLPRPARDRSPGQWQVGIPGTVVTVEPIYLQPHNHPDDRDLFGPAGAIARLPRGQGRDDAASVEYYGGYLLAESIGTRADAVLMAAAPRLQQAVRLLLDRCILNPQHASVAQRARTIARAVAVLESLADPPLKCLPPSPLAHANGAGVHFIIEVP